MYLHTVYSIFLYNDTANTEIYTLSLHDALPIFVEHSADRRPSRSTAGVFLPRRCGSGGSAASRPAHRVPSGGGCRYRAAPRSEEHTSELPSHFKLVCRILLHKKHTL